MKRRRIKPPKASKPPKGMTLIDLVNGGGSGTPVAHASGPGGWDEYCDDKGQHWLSSAGSSSLKKHGPCWCKVKGRGSP